MPDQTPVTPIASERMRRILISAFLALLAILLYSTVYHFVVPLTWAVVLVLTCWPVHRWLRSVMPMKPGAAAFLVTFALGLIILVPLGFVAVILVAETRDLGHALADLLTGKEGNLAEAVKGLPIVGEELHSGLVWIRDDPSGSLSQLLNENKVRLLAMGRTIATVITTNGFHFLVCMFATYFLFRHGDRLGEQVVRGVRRLGGDRLEELMQHVRETVKAVVYGLVMTAIAQAILSAFGFWLFGVPYPLLLGIMMFFISFIPFGPPLIWVPACLILLSREDYWRASLMFVYGVAIISTMDNIFRPLFIGQATKMSILLVFFGVLGGIFSFGMIGLFVGPVVIAVTLALWRDWVASQPRAAPVPEAGGDGAPPVGVSAGGDAGGGPHD